MNNEPPQFEGLDSELSNSYKASVPENEPPGQDVLQIKAVDPDHDPPNNLVRSPVQNQIMDFSNPHVRTTVNILKLRTLFSFCSQTKCWLSGLEFTNACQDSKTGKIL